MPKVHTVESLIRCIGYDPEHRVYWIEKELENGYVISVYGFNKESVVKVVRLEMEAYLKLRNEKLQCKRR